MDSKSWIDISIKILALVGVFIAAINYRNQRIIKKGEWLKSLFEKFYENDTYKEVRRWVDNKELEDKVDVSDSRVTDNDEKSTDFLNFFEFIANLENEKQIKLTDVTNLFEYYLQELRASQISQVWIKKYGFEKLAILLKKIK